MKIVGVESLTFGVEDKALAAKFWDDFGLELIEDSDNSLVYATEERTTMIVNPIDDPELPPAVSEGSTVRLYTWGVEAQSDLDEIRDELAKDRQVTVADDGTVATVDPNGYPIAFQVTKRQPVVPEPADYNRPGAHDRRDIRAKAYTKASPQIIGHVVVFSPNLDETTELYMDRLQFRMSDRYPDFGHFLRANGNNEHHNLFLLKAGDKIGFNHVAFELRNIHEVFGGGINMNEQGWETQFGPGRHPISSCYFWYIKNPCGGSAEYDSDTDHVTDDWETGVWEQDPQSLAEWAIDGGVGRFKGFEPGTAI